MIRAWLRRRRQARLEALRAERAEAFRFLGMCAISTGMCFSEAWDEADTRVRELDRAIERLERKLG